MENELELSAERENNVDSSLNDQVDQKDSSRKTRDSSLITENDLEDKIDSSDDHSPDHEDENDDDYSNYSKEEFVRVLKGLSEESSFKRIDTIAKEITPLFNQIRDHAKTVALEKFVSEGGVVEDFQFLPDKYDNEFDSTLKVLRNKRNKHFKTLDNQKTENLNKKNELLEKLRSLVDGEETENSFKIFKEIQNEWRGIGGVPGHQSRTLWASYTALVDRFYDQRNIHFELIELDRKKNLEMKLELCARAEGLSGVENVKDATKELNALHDEFKHLGPVSREEKENVWQRFKTASDAVYARRDALMAELHLTFKKNKEEKLAVIEEVGAFQEFTSDKIKEWNQKTKDIISLQKKWEAIGSVSRSDTKQINRKFWAAFKGFFSNKNLFFKKIDEEREGNLKLKIELVQKANELKESKDWDKTSNALKALQEEWQKIGPVPDKKREKIYKQFKTACDLFFELRREQFAKQDNEQAENLVKKNIVCDELENTSKQKTSTQENLSALMEQFNAIGFVPRNAINTIKSRYDKAVQSYLDSIEGLDSAEKGRVMMEIQLASLRSDPQGELKIRHKEQHIRKQIHKAESDIAILRNNMEFFGRSRNAENFKSQFNEKLEVASNELSELKKQLKLLITVS